LKRIPDPTGRFAERFYYENYELDDIAERLISEFLIKQHGKLVFPVPTDDLIKLIERDAADLDSYANLADEGKGVQGVTNFFPGKKPKVRIEAVLWEERTGHRLRTTLSHEYGHVHLHTPLFDAKGAQNSLDLFPSCCEAQKCHRDTLLPVQQGGDWLEWQAGYISGAILIPATHVCELINQIARTTGNYDSAVCGTPYANALINTVKDTYDVSKDAARVRLIQLGRIVKTHHQNQEISF
jgi:hypothetical protein